MAGDRKSLIVHNQLKVWWKQRTARQKLCLFVIVKTFYSVNNSVCRWNGKFQFPKTDALKRVWGPPF